MRYYKEFILPNGKECVIRTFEIEDAVDLYTVFVQTHVESDFLASDSDEINLTIEKEEKFIQSLIEDNANVEVGAFVDNKLVGSGGIDAIRTLSKTKHRCSFGVSILKEYCNQGIGNIIIKECLFLAKRMGYETCELQVVKENAIAIHVYEKNGFKEYGVHPKGFKKKDGTYQALSLMIRDL